MQHFNDDNNFLSFLSNATLTTVYLSFLTIYSFPTPLTDGGCTKCTVQDMVSQWKKRDGQFDRVNYKGTLPQPIVTLSGSLLNISNAS